MKPDTLKPFKQTVSLCPTCYKRIAGVVGVMDGSIYIKKHCPEHGETLAMVERDASFYDECMTSSARTIYAGYFIDITKKCNLKCGYCYYPVDNRSTDKTIECIMQDAIIHNNMAPFILTGGEPTLREDLCTIIDGLKRIGPVELLTNGTGLNKCNIDDISGLLSDPEHAAISLSIHPQIMDDNLRVLNLFREKGLKIEGILWVIDDLSQIDEIIELCDHYRDVVVTCRIKAATRVWNESKPEAKIFVSDMLHYMKGRGASVTWWRNNKVSFVTTELNGIYYMLVSWYDAHNIDMLDINCAPYYQAQTGETMNILTSMLINEGIQKGYLNGLKIKE